MASGDLWDGGDVIAVLIALDNDVKLALLQWGSLVIFSELFVPLSARKPLRPTDAGRQLHHYKQRHNAAYGDRQAGEAVQEECVREQH